MASIQPVAGGFRAQVKKRGVRDSRVFDTRSEAREWAAQREADILAGKRGAMAGKTLADLLTKYAEEVSSGKGGARWEKIRLAKIGRDEIGQKRLDELTPALFGQWRDRQLKTLKPGSVRREWGLLSAVFAKAVHEWRWLPESPLKGAARPAKPDHRDRLITQAEIDLIQLTANYTPGTPPGSATARVAAAFEFSIETGMRSGEVCALEWRDVFTSDNYVKVRRGKTRAARRDVPLTPRAAAILEELRAVNGQITVFQLTDGQRDALFRKIRDKGQIKDLHWHDTRHEAITRLSKKLDLLELARAVGIVDLKTLTVYYNETAAELAKKLQPTA